MAAGAVAHVVDQLHRPRCKLVVQLHAQPHATKSTSGLLQEVRPARQRSCLDFAEYNMAAGKASKSYSRGPPKLKSE